MKGETRGCRLALAFYRHTVALFDRHTPVLDRRAAFVRRTLTLAGRWARTPFNTGETRYSTGYKGDYAHPNWDAEMGASRFVCRTCAMTNAEA